jgi:hypothetical protein
MSAVVVIADPATVAGAFVSLVGLLEGVREEHFKGKPRLNMFEKAFQRLLDQIENNVMGASDEEGMEPSNPLTCEVADAIDFIETTVKNEGKCRCVINGAYWEVHP